MCLNLQSLHFAKKNKCRIFIIIYAMSWSWIFIRFTICMCLLFNRLNQTFLYLRIGNGFVEWQNGIIFVFMLAPFSIPRIHMWQLYWLSAFWAAHSLWIKWMLLSTFFFFLLLLEKTFTFYSNPQTWPITEIRLIIRFFHMKIKMRVT